MIDDLYYQVLKLALMYSHTTSENARAIIMSSLHEVLENLHEYEMLKINEVCKINKKPINCS